MKALRMEEGLGLNLGGCQMPDGGQEDALGTWRG